MEPESKNEKEIKALIQRIQNDPLFELTWYMCSMGLSVSQAIRRYTDIHGLPKGF